MSGIPGHLLQNFPFALEFTYNQVFASLAAPADFKKSTPVSPFYLVLKVGITSMGKIFELPVPEFVFLSFEVLPFFTINE